MYKCSLKSVSTMDQSTLFKKLIHQRKKLNLRFWYLVTQCAAGSMSKNSTGEKPPVFAKWGASIGDVQMLVEECKYDGPEYVV